MENISNIEFSKNNKEPENVNNFRLLAVSSCFLKVFEIMIKNRLEWLVGNKKNILTRYQMGSRKEKGFFDNTVYLTPYDQIAFTKMEPVIRILLNIITANDIVNLFILWKFLIELKIDIEIANVKLKILTNKLIYSKDKNGDVHSRIISNCGIPQGSLLSPISLDINRSFSRIWWRPIQKH